MVGEPSRPLCGRPGFFWQRIKLWDDVCPHTEAAPNEPTVMRCRPAYQTLITDASGRVSVSARFIRHATSAAVARRKPLRDTCLQWDIRSYSDHDELMVQGARIPLSRNQLGNHPEEKCQIVRR